MQVSFGKKVPIMQCSIKDVQRKMTVPATIYEYDCQCSSDIEDMLYAGRDWFYNINLACDMKDKYEKENFMDEISPRHFYVMENQNGKMLALCETKEVDSDIQVEFIETEHNKEQKYCGKTMLAALGKKVIENNGSKLMINIPLNSAFDFYVQGCGFNTLSGNSLKLQMEKHKIKNFISETEAQSGGEILNIKI